MCSMRTNIVELVETMSTYVDRRDDVNRRQYERTYTGKKLVDCIVFTANFITNLTRF